MREGLTQGSLFAIGTSPRSKQGATMTTPDIFKQRLLNVAKTVNEAADYIEAFAERKWPGV